MSGLFCVTSFRTRECLPCAAIAAIPAHFAQEEHKIQRLENRAAYYEKGERRKRAHRLITRGAAIESVAPQTKGLSETAFYAFAEQVFALPDAQRLLMEAVSRHAGGD